MKGNFCASSTYKQEMHPYRIRVHDKIVAALPHILGVAPIKSSKSSQKIPGSEKYAVLESNSFAPYAGRGPVSICALRVFAAVRFSPPS
jgi:hypothetical protein